MTSVGTLRLQVWPEFGHVLRVGRLGRDGLIRHVRVPGFDAAGHGRQAFHALSVFESKRLFSLDLSLVDRRLRDDLRAIYLRLKAPRFDPHRAGLEGMLGAASTGKMFGSALQAEGV